jgi:hypothetical protein
MHGRQVDPVFNFELMDSNRLENRVSHQLLLSTARIGNRQPHLKTASLTQDLGYRTPAVLMPVSNILLYATACIVNPAAVQVKFPIFSCISDVINFHARSRTTKHENIFN